MPDDVLDGNTTCYVRGRRNTMNSKTTNPQPNVREQRDDEPEGDLGHGGKTWKPPSGEQGISNREDDKFSAADDGDDDLAAISEDEDDDDEFENDDDEDDAEDDDTEEDS
jgi:hypothetical protein